MIIPAYQSKPYLQDCLLSLEQQKGVDLRIIVSDNNSQDGSLEYVKRNHPKVEILKNKENLGFSAAVNRGLEHAKGEPFVALINPDTRTDPKCIRELIRALLRSKQAGVAAANMRNMTNPDLIDCQGVAITSAFGQLSIGSNRPSFPGFHRDRFAPSACGGGMMIRAEVIQDIGLFDEDYFLCWEDLEYSLRAFRAGYRCVFAPKALVYHKTSSIMGKWSKLNVFHYCRGALPTAIKHLPLPLVLRHGPAILFNRIKLAVLYAGAGRLGSAIKGDLSGLLLAFKMFRKRKALPRIARGVSFEKLLREGDRIRKMMKHHKDFPGDAYWEIEGRAE